MSNLSHYLARCGSLAPAALASTAAPLSLLATRRVLLMSAARRATPVLSRQATQFAPRAFSTRASQPKRVLRSRFMPIAFAGAALAVVVYLEQQKPTASFKMDLKPEKTETKAYFQPSLMLEPASGVNSGRKCFEPIDEDLPPEIARLPVEDAVLTNAPFVPPVITRDYEALVRVPLITSTKLAQLTSQYKYEQWTFNGTVPGPFIRAKVGNVVELSLTNKDTTGNPHNIDCHAFTGPGGGAAVTTVEENETKTARFKLLYPGLYVYHCAAAPVPVHIANGMYGLMYVQPEKDDLPPVDKEYYVMQSEFYHEPPEVDDDGRRSETVEFSYPNGLREEPQVVAFNGSESALTRDHPLKAEVGDDVRIFFGNAGPNLTSSFHVIGSHFKNVYRDGDVLSPPSRAIQTVTVPSGGSSIFDLKMQYPGTYTMVDHSIFRLDKGAVGFLNVSGKPVPGIYESPKPPRPCVGCKLHA
ncbi:copper-containing nitrite reductase [Plectosphaerella cucumerina]|uniref:Copper-containing nitrite reductase n=1 Tax=Plectosphaerella cucumerina TaxID=40658 RepID=A0A8K0T1P5_9PEZI|nr:copper-containing nitrite reductase [Plectosphaerella cucumerina]